MSLSKLILVASLALSAVSQAQQARCPAHRGNSPLSSVVVFDGPPAERADLIPDVSKGSGDHAYASWEVSYIFDSGRTLFLVCRFAGLADTQSVTVKVEKKVKHCTFRTHRSPTPADVSCR